MPDATEVRIDLKFDAAGFTRAMENMRAAFRKLGESIATAFAGGAAAYRDAVFVREGGRFYTTIVTGSDGVTRAVRRRDFRAWRRPYTSTGLGGERRHYGHDGGER